MFDHNQTEHGPTTPDITAADTAACHRTQYRSAAWATRPQEASGHREHGTSEGLMLLWLAVAEAVVELGGLTELRGEFYAITFPLQWLAAQNAAWTLDLLGIPVLLDGNVIHLSQVTLGVTEACSGVRSLISLLALAVAWSALSLRGVWAPTVFVAS